LLPAVRFLRQKCGNPISAAAPSQIPLRVLTAHLYIPLVDLIRLLLKKKGRDGMEQEGRGEEGRGFAPFMKS